MKKILLASLVVIAPAIASAQQLVSGYNFGQFLTAGNPAIDAGTEADEGKIGANWAHNSPPPLGSRGDSFANSPGFSNGTGTVFWDGVNAGSTLGGVVAFNNPAPSINASTITGANMALIGDHNGANMALDVLGASSIGFQQNMAGFNDAGGVDLTFAAQGSMAPITINWIFAGNTIATTNVTTNWAAYTVNLPSSFYGVISDLTASFSGAGRLDNVQFNGVAIPEPSTYAAMLSALTLGVVALRRRKNLVAA